MDISELGLLPISENNPSGDDVRYEPEFEALENEIQKLSSPSSSEGIDWNKVISLSSDILGGRSKNLLVASYLCIALINVKGLQGFADGIHVLRGLLENFWETMYPPKKRMRGRTNAIDWWVEKVDAIIENKEVEKWPSELRTSFADDLHAIDTFLGENVEDAPILTTMNERILALVEIEKAPELPSVEEPSGEVSREKVDAAPAESKEKETVIPDAPPPTLKSVQTQEADTGEDAEKLIKQGLDILGKAATLLIKKENLTSVPFRLNRIVAWLPVQNLPPVSDGKTLIPPPDEQIISTLRNMYQTQKWRDLLQAAESRVRQFLFWIDLSRYVAESLEQLRYPDICSTVSSETLNYVNRLPGIEKLAFADGTPFADVETKEWLRTLIQQHGTAGASTGPGGSEIEQLVEQELAQSQKLIKENKLPGALSGFKNKVNSAASSREQFIWEIGLCRLLLRAKLPKLVVPNSLKILEMIDTYKIDEWEPALAVDGLTVVLSGLKLQEDNKDEELIKKIIDRIATINPARVLDFI
ncbi:MAG: type VI secretion system protein TssA [Candidatus Latescibacteria bacterium]|nr:type VI secretion system protein TssA [Candidatus Latescibacterota bacterium]